MSETMATTIDQIKAELRRLGCASTHRNPEGLEVEAEPELPAGWVRVYDSTASAYGPAVAILEALRGADAFKNLDPDGQPCGFDAAWEALGAFDGKAPHSEA